MMRHLLQLARKIRHKYISDNWVGLPIARAIYRWSTRHIPLFEQKGMPVNIGGSGYFRVHPRLAIGTYDFEHWGGGHNSGFHQWVKQCHGKKSVFDIGAHIGLYALPASRVLHSDGRLYAFEPADVNRLFLIKHIVYNRAHNIEVLPDLVGDEQKQGVAFFEAETVHGMNTIVQETAERKSGTSKLRETVKNQIKLDDFCRERRAIPEVIKIDVEGGEFKVLRGAEEMIKNTHPIIFLSVHPQHLRCLGSSAEELSEYIRALGYTIYDMQGQPAVELNKEEYILKC